MLGYGPVGLRDAALADHVVQARERLRRLGEEHRPAHGTVDAVNHAQEDVARLVVAHLDHGLDLGLQRIVGIAVGLHQVAAALVYHHQVVVLVEDIVGSEHCCQSLNVKGRRSAADDTTVAVPPPDMMIRTGEP